MDGIGSLQCQRHSGNVLVCILGASYVYRLDIIGNLYERDIYILIYLWKWSCIFLFYRVRQKRVNRGNYRKAIRTIMANSTALLRETEKRNHLISMLQNTAEMVAQRMTVLRANWRSTNEIHHDDIGELMILVDFLATLTILACLVIRYSVSWSWLDFLDFEWLVWQ